jgi:adapter protein MecA 1/2
MRFSRIGEHTIKCIISEEEIVNLGFTMDEIMSNGERTQEFMNQIFDLAEQEFETKFDLGVKTVRADFMPDHTLSLTFSEHPGATGMMEHLKDIVNGLINSIPKEKWEELQKMQAASNPVCVIALLVFSDMERLIRFTKQVDIKPLPPSSLYRYQNRYYLILDLAEKTESEVLRLSVLTDEYASDIEVGETRRAFLEEHGTAILKQEALEQLQML